MTTDCRRINVSFKNNERDEKLLNYVRSKNDKSNFIKDCIEFYLNNNSVENCINKEVKTKRKVKF